MTEKYQRRKISFEIDASDKATNFILKTLKNFLLTKTTWIYYNLKSEDVD